jgi:hypothetical protein
MRDIAAMYQDYIERREMKVMGVSGVIGLRVWTLVSTIRIC